MIVYMRIRRGVLAEERRLVHAVDFPDDADPAVEQWPYQLAALCGYTLMPGYGEQLDVLTGAWCPVCFALLPEPPRLGQLS